MDERAIESAIGERPVRVERVGGGAAGAVARFWLGDGSKLIAKSAPGGLNVEAQSLRLLAERSGLPVPSVRFASETFLIMEDAGVGRGLTRAGEEHAAALLADLHGRLSADGRYGLEFDNTIGPLRQPNGWSPSWVEFWRERRILEMARGAEREGHLPGSVARRLEALAARLGGFIPDDPPAALMHGDIWGGNVVGDGDRVAAFIDPSPYYGHAEVELAFITMFSTFGEAFFEAYGTLRPIDGLFWKTRREVYLLYPLLTHVRIYAGGGYVGQVDRVLRGLGF